MEEDELDNEVILSPFFHQPTACHESDARCSFEGSNAIPAWAGSLCGVVPGACGADDGDYAGRGVGGGGGEPRCGRACLINDDSILIRVLILRCAGRSSSYRASKMDSTLSLYLTPPPPPPRPPVPFPDYRSEIMKPRVPQPPPRRMWGRGVYWGFGQRATALYGIVSGAAASEQAQNPVGVENAGQKRGIYLRCGSAAGALLSVARRARPGVGAPKTAPARGRAARD
jgi:hypothetical protein